MNTYQEAYVLVVSLYASGDLSRDQANPILAALEDAEQAQEACGHNFIFLRQETRNEGYPRNPNWVVYDVFFCAKCLERQQRKVDARYAEYTGPTNERVR